MSDTLVVNELLAFMQQKLDVMDEVSVIQICATKLQLVFWSLNKSDQMVSRRRDGTRKSLQDIITLFKETDPDDVLTFVVRDLDKLPPVTFDHDDVTSLLKDIVFLKASLAEVQMKLSVSEVIVADLRIEFEVFGNNWVTDMHASTQRLRVMRQRFCRWRRLLSLRYAPQARHAAPLPHPQLLPAVLRIKRTADPTVTASAPVKPLPTKAKDRATEDGFVTVQRRKHWSRNIKNECGKAPVDPNLKVRAASLNTPVYISRLHYTTEAEDIAKYVCQKLKYVPRVQLLESRRNVNFKPFVVHVPNFYLHKVLDESFWSQDVVFRHVHGQVPAERTNI